MEIGKNQINSAISIFKYIYPRFSENIQEWNNNIQVTPGYLYFVKKDNKIVQIFTEFDDEFLNEVRLVRLLKKRKVIQDHNFIIMISNNRWRVGWKV